MKKIRIKKEKTRFLIWYSCIFLAICVLVFYYFAINGKSFVWSHDGVPQHVNSLAYYGHYLRTLLKNLIFEHRVSLPMWDMNIGYGSDILTTLHYYVIGDPLALLSVFVPVSQTELLYELLIVLRIYLAGLAFAGFCSYHKNQGAAILYGTLIYVFAGWTIYAVVKHPYFANPMIYLPLLLMGIDKVYKKEKPHLFIGMVAVSALSNFYFFYMLCIFMFLYAAFRYFMLTGHFRIKEIGLWFLKFLGYFVIGLSIAAVIFLPVVLSMLGTDRFQAENYVPLFYDRIYYEKYLGCLIGENMMHWGVAGYSAVSMAGVFVLFARKKRDSYLKGGFLLLNLFLLIPFAGHMLNGFSYVSNRWIWAYGMLISYIFVKMYPEFYKLTIREKKKIFLMLVCYCVLALFAESARTQRNLCAVLILVLSTMLILSFGQVFTKKEYLWGALGVCLLAGIYLNAHDQYSYEREYLEEFSASGKNLEKLASGADEAVRLTQNADTCRYDQFGALPYANTSMQTKTNSTTYYFSLSNGNISEYFNSLYLNTPWEYHYENLDGRTILDRLAAVRYFVVKEGDEAYLPYGYRKKSSTAQKGNQVYSAYECQNALPLGYTYETSVEPEEYEKMTAPEKQQALLQSVVMEDSSLPEGEPSFNHEEIPWKAVKSQGCSIEDKKIRVEEENAVLEIVFQGREDSETYLMLEDWDYEALSPRELYDEEEWEKLTRYEQQKVLHETSLWRDWKEGQKAVMSVQAGEIQKEISVFTDYYNGYSGKHNFLCNLGYQDEGLTRMTLTFENTGVYSFRKFEVVCQPMEQVDAYTDALKKDTLQEIQIGTNEIKGTISLNERKALLLAIPYSRGWTAYVDGKETELKKANGMFLALELEPGKHEIHFTYRTPYLLAGACLSAAGLAAWLFLIFYRKVHWTVLTKKKRAGETAGGRK